MELGRYSDAYQSLKSISNYSSFDFLIRKSKWEDHKGNLEGSIRLMEEALRKIKSKNTNLYCWALSNLGDLYGHAGRIKDAYAAYLDVLKLNPSDVYCLMRIARIAYVKDKNISLAKKILFFIQEQCSFPEINLLLAEIAETENRPDEAKMYSDIFLTQVSREGYGRMYNKYLIDILSSGDSTVQQALNLALMELKNRFTPETSDWVAWAYYNTGNYSEALKWTTSYVLGQTSEPQTLMHSAFILAANGRNLEARELLKEALGSSFELGPVAEKSIKELLNTL
jgi:tetratricopeptide (TPR) repeat protein